MRCVWCVYVMLCVECALVYLGMYGVMFHYLALPIWKFIKVHVYIYFSHPLIRTAVSVYLTILGPHTLSIYLSIYLGEEIRWFRSHSKSLTR